MTLIIIIMRLWGRLAVARALRHCRARPRRPGSYAAGAGLRLAAPGMKVKVTVTDSDQASQPGGPLRRLLDRHESDAAAAWRRPAGDCESLTVCAAGPAATAGRDPPPGPATERVCNRHHAAAINLKAAFKLLAGVTPRLAVTRDS